MFNFDLESLFLELKLNGVDNDFREKLQSFYLRDEKFLTEKEKEIFDTVLKSFTWFEKSYEENTYNDYKEKIKSWRTKFPVPFKKNIVITGINSGIGLHSAKVLKERGFEVIGTIYDNFNLDEVNSLGIDVVRLDYEDSKSISSAAEEILEKTNGNIYTLFNNGAYAQFGSAEETSMDDLRSLFDCHFFGWVEFTKQFIPSFKKQRYGRIIFNGSINSFVTMRFRSGYCAAKAAMKAYSESLGRELHSFGIKVISIDSGGIRTNILDRGKKSFLNNIDITNSPYANEYVSLLEKIEDQDNKIPWMINAEAFTNRLISAVEDIEPREMYEVSSVYYIMNLIWTLLPRDSRNRLVNNYLI